VETGPNALEEDLAAAVARTSAVDAAGVAGMRAAVGGILAGLLALQLVDRLADVGGAESALGADVLEDRLGRGGLRQRTDGVGEEAAEPRLAAAVHAAHADESDLARLVTSDTVGLLELAWLHLRHGDEEGVGNEVAVLFDDQLRIGKETIPWNVSRRAIVVVAIAIAGLG